ncbi:MAG: iron export ABC transporter permease subunit FetB [Candidatus Eisenbacteria sp.]|nr:iron export ABC transporter permease subunit FetB [Candidatus Eisenbacteria bacterium]
MGSTPGSPIALGWEDLAVAAGLVVVAGVISLLMKLRIERRLAIASLRTVVQLLLIGYVLEWVFAARSLLALAPIVMLMVAGATHAAIRRPRRSLAGIGWRAFLTLVTSGLITTITATAVIIGVRPWYEPHYLVPLLGMVLGNTMNAISLSVDHLLETLTERRGEVEMELALGATRWEAARGPIADAVRRGMIPIVNSMTVVGIVSLPGMMTGQILAGADPVVAVRYQIMIMFMLAAGTALGSIGMAMLVYRRLFNQRHQLLAEAIRRRG